MRFFGKYLQVFRLSVLFRADLAGNLGRKFSEPIQDLVGPEALEAVQRLVQRRELLVGDAADLLDGLDVLLIERIDDAADFLALVVRRMRTERRSTRER